MTEVNEQATASAAPPSGRPESKPILIWAAVGVIWLMVCVTAMYGWLSGPDFGAPEIQGPDKYPASQLVGLRVVEALSTGVLGVAVYFLAWRPWWRDRDVTLDALLLLGGITGFVMDCWLNTQAYLFAFNAHSINLGAWAASLPFHKDDVPSHYSESLLWGMPMYIYFCAALGYVGTLCARRLQSRWPGASVQSILLVLFAGDVLFDFVVENVIIRTTAAYAFVQTYEPLTLWAGESYQFPFYESLLVGLVSVAFTYARWSMDWDRHGLSIIERGALSVPERLELPARALAAIGYCAVVLMVCYHLPLNWVSLAGDSFADIPSYLAPVGLYLP